MKITFQPDPDKKRKDGNFEFWLEGDKMCTSAALDQYRSIIKKVPRWPFSHAVLAICLERQGNKSWEEHGRRAIGILEKTVKVPNHDNDHDLVGALMIKLFQKAGKDSSYIIEIE